MTQESQTAAAFVPTSFAAFRFVAAEIDAAAPSVTLRYALEGADRVTFAETVSFDGMTWPTDPARREVLRRLTRILHLLAGVSYYKTAVPSTIVLEDEGPDRPGAPGPLSGRLRTLLQDVYTLGLGEFAYRNRIDIRERVRFPDAVTAGEAAAPGDATDDGAFAVDRPVALPETGRTLVPIGGGKDSVVALEIVQRSGRRPICFSVGRHGPIVRCVEVTGLPYAVTTRSLSPNIGEVNAGGALNGHVPVTAVVSTIALMTAVLQGADAVAMANERSASEANLVWDGLEVNHQWSKGAAFEVAFRDLLTSEVATGLDYRSVLRPAGELAIARAFSRLEHFHPHFTSCNAVFRIDPARRHANWCGNCPKCRFVFLALAPYLDPPALTRIFGVDMLDDPTQYDGFCDLAGLRDHKPFECVGEEAESLVAMRLVAARDVWADRAVVRRLRDEQLAGLPEDPAVMAGPFRLEPDALAALPEDLRVAAQAVLGG